MSPTRRDRRRTALFAAALLLAAPLTQVVAGTTAAAGDSPGFYYGSDSNAPAGTGRMFPYRARGTGGRYGSYVGEVGTWTDWLGCTSGEALNATALDEANADEQTRYPDRIPGVFFYWFAAGPGADPDYDGTRAQAHQWGVDQAEAAVAAYDRLAAEGLITETTYIPLMFMDVETQPVAGYGNGWNEIVDSCGQITDHRRVVIPPAVDRATFNGFTSYLHRYTIFHPGVYSTSAYWYYTFGYGPASRIPDTYEWTPVASTAAVTPAPVGFCQEARCAEWFGGVETSKEAGWQWDHDGGDYDQWDTADLPT